VIGWGYDEEKDQHYWIIRNSYGDAWGQNGDFHVRMGQDDYGAESELSGFNVNLLD
jgi:C1A family cysteine protease